MDEAFIEQLVALGVIPEEQALLLRQAQQGQQAFQTPGAQGQNVGGTYVASSPLEHLGVLAQRASGAAQQGRADEGLQDTFARQTAGRGAFARQQMGQQDEETEMMKALIQALQGGTAPQGPAGWGNGY